MKKLLQILLLVAFASCKKDYSKVVFDNGTIVKFDESGCTVNGHGCAFLARIDSIDLKHSHAEFDYNFYHTTNNDGVDQAAGVKQYRKATDAESKGFTYKGKSIYIPYWNNACHLKTDTAYWVAQGFLIKDFNTVLHLQ